MENLPGMVGLGTNRLIVTVVIYLNLDLELVIRNYQSFKFCASSIVTYAQKQ